MQGQGHRPPSAASEGRRHFFTLYCVFPPHDYCWLIWGYLPTLFGMNILLAQTILLELTLIRLLVVKSDSE